MQYRVIGLMSGSSLDGLDVVFAELNELSGKWTYEIRKAACYPYEAQWKHRLQQASALSAVDYQLLHVDFGHLLGELVNRFIAENELHYQVQLIASHGHTVFHMPEKKMTAQVGDGASIAAVTGIHVISDLRSMDIAFGGQGAPIVPIGEGLFWGNYDFFLNMGGIANVSAHSGGSGSSIAFDVCPANRVLNLLAGEEGMDFDDQGSLAQAGLVNADLLEKLNQLPYYQRSYPKSLANELGTGIIYPMITQAQIETKDALRTYAEHICVQINNAVLNILSNSSKVDAKAIARNPGSGYKMLVTGGGAHNSMLMSRLQQILNPLGVELDIPPSDLIDYKEALIMALFGTLRWREQINVLSSVTGASRDSVGGAVWMGQLG